jgi:hypothetical protein
MDMNPAMEMDVPDGTENTKPEFIPPVDVNDRKFIDLAKKIKKLSPETLSMIQKDLQPEDTKAEPTEDPEDPTEEGDSCSCGKPDCKECNPPSKDPRAMLIIGLKKVLSQV